MAPPTTDLGTIDFADVIGAQWIDVNEVVPDLAWPNSVAMYSRMRHDPRLTAIIKAYSLPIRRATWAIDPAGCRDEVVQVVADDLGLPILGADPAPTGARRRGVSWGGHLRTALLSLTYGFMPFERRYEIRNQRARLANLGERMPWTIGAINLNRDGTIESVQQNLVGSSTIPANRLVWYAHDREGATWTGRSLLRAAYGPWLLKHEMWRVHATSIRRFGMGIPSVEAPAGATPAQVQEAQRLASAMRVGDTSGVGLPPGFKLSITGMTGSVPDVVEYIHYLDQQMSTMALAGWLDLGQTQTGSRALGDSFIDQFLLSLRALADEIADTATSGQPGLNGVVTNLVDLNWGEDEPAPRIVCTDVGEDRSLTVEAINGLLASGALHADDDLEAWLRGTYRLPPRKLDDVATAERSYAYDLDYGILTVDERRAQINLPPLPNGAGQNLPTPSNLRYAPPDEETAPEAPQIQAAARRRTTKAANRRRQVRAAGNTTAGHRQLTTIEAASGMDPDAVQGVWQTALDKLLELWASFSGKQRAELIEQIQAAVGDDNLEALGDLDVDSDDAGEALAGVLAEVAQESAEMVVAEAATQGVAITGAISIALDRLAELARAVARIIANGLAAAAGREALRVWTPGRDATQVAEMVDNHLDSLTDSYLREQLGGALSAAQNSGRIAAFEQGPAATYWASEILDQSTCLACSEIDGQQFEDLAEAGEAYASGGFVGCEGRLRCRGVIVATWGDS
ncbi:hypothetical protein ACFVH6_21940 [Spirillospora sp. NPDC127200]